MKVGWSKTHTLQLRIWDFHTGWIGASVQAGFHGQPRAGPHAANELHHRLVIDQWPAPPVLRDVAEEAVLDLVPLRGARRKVRHADGQATAVREALQLHFPRPRARAVAAAGIRRDEEGGRRGIG